jgi:hypothetical protein
MDKLEIIDEFKKLYGDKINPDLIHIKYCQSKTSAMLEMSFTQNPSNPIIIDLKIIGGEIEKNDNGDYIDILPLFNPKTDIVDNAKALIDLDPYSLINCIENLFTNEAEQLINKNHLDETNASKK